MTVRGGAAVILATVDKLNLPLAGWLVIVNITTTLSFMTHYKTKCIKLITNILTLSLYNQHKIAKKLVKIHQND